MDVKHVQMKHIVYHVHLDFLLIQKINANQLKYLLKNVINCSLMEVVVLFVEMVIIQNQKIVLIVQQVVIFVSIKKNVFSVKMNIS